MEKIQKLKQEATSLRIVIRFLDDGSEQRKDCEQILKKLDDEIISLKTGGYMESAWDFVEQWYPNYHSSNEIMRADDLQKILDEEDEEESGAHKLRIELDSNLIDHIDEWKIVHCDIYEKAIMNFIKHGAP